MNILYVLIISLWGYTGTEWVYVGNQIVYQEPMTKEQKTVAHTSHANAENGTKQNEDASSAISDETDEKASKVGQSDSLCWILQETFPE